jgi:hypothetical protein
LLKKDCKEPWQLIVNYPEGRSKLHNSKIEGIKDNEVQRRKIAGEILRCAWPSDRKGTHRVRNCIRPIKLDRETASYNKDKTYQRLESLERSSKDNTSTDTEESSD